MPKYCIGPGCKNPRPIGHGLCKECNEKFLKSFNKSPPIYHGEDRKEILKFIKSTLRTSRQRAITM